MFLPFLQLYTTYLIAIYHRPYFPYDVISGRQHGKSCDFIKALRTALIGYRVKKNVTVLKMKTTSSKKTRSEYG